MPSPNRDRRNRYAASKDDGLIAPRVLSHYRQMGIIPGWNRERFIKLCAIAQRVPEEIGAMAGLMPSQTRAYMERDLFPPPVSLHFALIGAVVRERKFGEPWIPIVPLDLIEPKP